MEPTVQASARHTIHATADTWRIRLSASAHAHPNDAYARRAEAIATISSVLIDVPLFGERLNESTAYDGQINAEWNGEVTGTDVEIAREIISRLAAVPDVQVDGPTWSLSDSAALEASARALEGAAETAKNTAVTIAESLGGNLGKLLNATTETHSATPAPVRVEMMAARSAQPPRTLELKLAPSDVEVTEKITVTFEFVAE
ncbi:hypothetical protein N24_0624 [Corynebacterium suranareeae]|uniref:SIMPL domain-containing protein n=1 Tax=Corynebacterium suranareeae TaxID=2506452 RepID=A0A160PND9_9CORY|nr:SIMPL domain-containing protein [Corynebacterium suranareeae]BAU94886.1 hypothetical protein N24_0624 [Corynebacterium suranareeae]